MINCDYVGYTRCNCYHYGHRDATEEEGDQILSEKRSAVRNLGIWFQIGLEARRQISNCSASIPDPYPHLENPEFANRHCSPLNDLQWVAIRLVARRTVTSGRHLHYCHVMCK